MGIYAFATGDSGQHQHSQRRTLNGVAELFQNVWPNSSKLEDCARQSTTSIRQPMGRDTQHKALRTTARAGYCNPTDCSPWAPAIICGDKHATGLLHADHGTPSQGRQYQKPSHHIKMRYAAPSIESGCEGHLEHRSIVAFSRRMWAPCLTVQSSSSKQSTYEVERRLLWAAGSRPARSPNVWALALLRRKGATRKPASWIRRCA